jgi:hypothetical protein
VSASAGVKRWTEPAVLAAVLVAGCSAPVHQPEAKSAVNLAAWGPCIMTESMPDSNGAYPGVECSTLTGPFDYTRPDGPVPYPGDPDTVESAEPQAAADQPGRGTDTARVERDDGENSTLVVAPAQGHIASSQNGCAEDTLVAFLM